MNLVEHIWQLQGESLKLLVLFICLLFFMELPLKLLIWFICFILFMKLPLKLIGYVVLLCFSISQLFCCVKFKYHLSSRKWQAQLCLIQWVLCELMLLDMSYLCKFSMDYIGSLVQLKQLQLDRLAFRLHKYVFGFWYESW